MTASPPARARCSRSSGVAAPPTRMASNVVAAAVASGSARMRVSWVGTSEVNRVPVGMPATAAVNRAAVKGAPVSSTLGSLPSARQRRRTWRPAMCCAGSASSHCPDRGRGTGAGPLPRWGCQPSRQVRRQRVASAEAVRAEAGSSTPFTGPVEPEVATTSAVGSPSSSSPGSRGSPTRSWSGTIPASPAATGSSAGPSPPKARANLGSRSRRASPVGISRISRRRTQYAQGYPEKSAGRLPRNESRPSTASSVP